MKKNDLPIDEIIKEYVSGVSPYELSEKYSTYPNMIRRILKRAGVTLRNKSDAQKNALSNGVVHPTAGRKRTPEELVNISRGLVDSYQKLPESEKKKRSERAKAQWDAMSDDKKREFSEASVKAVLIASKEGSKLENEILNGIRELGYTCQHHSDVIMNEKMEVDIFVPELKVCIEVDGPAHFSPIWGKEKLKRVQESDSKKNGLLISAGYVIIRIQNLNKPSLAATKALVDRLKDIFDSVKLSFPQMSDRYIEIIV